MRKRYTEEQRAELVRVVREEKVPLRRAALRLGVAEATAYYWVKREAREGAGRQRVAGRRARSATPAAGEVAFARRVAASASRPLIVRVGAAVLEVPAGFDAALLRAVVMVLTEPS